MTTPDLIYPKHLIRAISREEILNGLAEDKGYFCCMFGTSLHHYRYDMWSRIYDEVGSIGFLARESGNIIGQLTFLPKVYARKIALATCPENDRIDTTLSISCLYVAKDDGNKGIGSAMIEETLSFCRTNAFNRIEAPVDHRPPPESGINTSYYPFRKFGFVLDGSREAWESRPDSRMCFLDLW